MKPETDQLTKVINTILGFLIGFGIGNVILIAAGMLSERNKDDRDEER